MGAHDEPRCRVQEPVGRGIRLLENETPGTWLCSGQDYLLNGPRTSGTRQPVPFRNGLRMCVYSIRISKTFNDRVTC